MLFSLEPMGSPEAPLAVLDPSKPDTGLDFSRPGVVDRLGPSAKMSLDVPGVVASGGCAFPDKTAAAAADRCES